MGAERETDETLMERFRDGDAAAFDRLYHRHKGALFRYLRRGCRDPSAAEELFQDVWLNLIRARARYRVEARFTTYLYRIAHNRLVDHHRRRPQAPAGASPGGDEPAANPADEPERRAHLEREAARVQALVRALPEEQREAFLLHEEGGLGVDAIAEVTGVGRETAKSRLRYAVRKLKRGLERDD